MEGKFFKNYQFFSLKIIFFWSYDQNAHLNSIYKKINSLENKYLSYKLISLNINDDFDKWKSNYKPTNNVIELQTNDFEYMSRKLILDNIEELARLECLGTGLILREIKGFHIHRAAYNFRFFAQYISQAHGERYDNTEGYITLVNREPAGVVGLIAPWNAPLALATMKIASAIAFGNCAILKPSEQTPFSLIKLAIVQKNLNCNLMIIF